MNKYMPGKRPFFFFGYLIIGEEEEEKPQIQALICSVYVRLGHRMLFHEKCYRSISSPYVTHIPLQLTIGFVGFIIDLYEIYISLQIQWLIIREYRPNMINLLTSTISLQIKGKTTPIPKSTIT